MEMLSYSTIDNEGRYDILKDQGFDVSTLTKENMDDKYNSVMISGIVMNIRITLTNHLPIRGFVRKTMLHMVVN